MNFDSLKLPKKILSFHLQNILNHKSKRYVSWCLEPIDEFEFRYYGNMPCIIICKYDNGMENHNNM